MLELRVPAAVCTSVLILLIVGACGSSSAADESYNPIVSMIDPMFGGASVRNVPREALDALNEAQNGGSCKQGASVTELNSSQYKIMCDTNDKPRLIGGTIVPGRDISRVSVTKGTYSRQVAVVELTDEGRSKLREFSEIRSGFRMAIVKDGRLCATPLPAEPISGNKLTLNGGRDVEGCLQS